ncbi:hypothetical protein BH23PLA1_BH23PLA1_26060 [soil metagenome]
MNEQPRITDRPNVNVYGSRSCPDTTRALRYLDVSQIDHEFLDVDSNPELNAYISELNQGKRVIPTIRINNHTLINPTNQEIAKVYDEELPRK